jgi:glycosyltransferase involved in cell wall biosynthesis
VKLHVATLFAGVPNPWEAGGPLTHWALLSALLDRGHRVSFVALPWDSPPSEARLTALRSRGAEVVVLPPPSHRFSRGRSQERRRYLRSVLWPGDETLFPTAASAPALAHTIRELEPDFVVAHATNAVSAAAGLPLRKLALVSDPPGLSRRLRTRWDPQYPWRLGRDELLYRLGSASFAYRADRRFVQLLRRFDSVGVFGAHRAKWARRRGVKAWYAKSPIEDGAGSDWRARRAGAEPNTKPRILLIGHLRGISTISGLHVFADEVLPELERELGPEGFEAHIVGAHDPPASLRAALEHPAVRLRGHVEPPDDEFLRADVLLVPTPVETGPRVRIVTGFSFGCCVVAHAANRLGIPMLEDGVNILLADSPGLARATLTALADPTLRTRLGEAGRGVYEENFTPELAGGRIAEELERIASARV